MDKKLKTYLVSLAVDYEGVEDGDRAGVSEAGLEAVIAFRKTLSKFITENELNGEVKVINEDSISAIVTVQTTSEIAQRLRKLDGVEAVVDGETPMELI